MLNIDHFAIDSEKNNKFIKILERISEQSTIRHAKDVENIAGIKLRFTLPKYDLDGGQQFQEYLPEEVSGDGFMLPVFLLTDVNTILSNILSRGEEYPFFFSFSENSITKSKTFIHDYKYLSILPAILDFSIEKFIYTEAVKEMGLNYIEEMGYYKNNISNILVNGKVNAEYLYISLKDKIIEYQNVINKIIQSEGWCQSHGEYSPKKNLIDVDYLNWGTIYNENKFKLYYRIDKQIYQNSVNVYARKLEELPADNVSNNTTLEQ